MPTGFISIERKDRIAEAYLEHLTSQRPMEELRELLQEGFVGLRHAQDEDLFRIGMMIGYFNEDT